MPTTSFKISDFSQSSTWTGTENYISGDLFISYDTPSTSQVTKNLSLASIPSNTVLDSALLTADYNSPYTGAAIRRVNDVNFGGSMNLLSVLQAMNGVYGTLALIFKFKANGGAGGAGAHTSSLAYENVKLTVTYHEPYTACGAPTSASVSPTLAESDPTLTFSGATDGTNNSILNYEVQYADSADGVAWGAWSGSYMVLWSGMTVALPGSRGVYRKYRIRARGSAGEAYYSAWKETNVIRRNRLPGALAVSSPANNTTIYNGRPYAVISIGAEPDGQTQRIQIKIDDGDYAYFGGAFPSAGGTIKAQLPNLPFDGYTNAQEFMIRFRTVDDLGAVGPETTRNIWSKVPSWDREINSGTVVSGGGVSHQAEIIQMRDRINDIRAYYALTPATLPGTPGRFVYWLPQMQALQAALGACYTASGRAAPAWIVSPHNRPRADIINQLRAAIAQA